MKIIMCFMSLLHLLLKNLILLQVDFPSELLAPIDETLRPGLLGVLARDPRPRYQDDPDRIYGMAFGGWEIRFRVDGDALTVVEARPAD